MSLRQLGFIGVSLRVVDVRVGRTLSRGPRREIVRFQSGLGPSRPRRDGPLEAGERRVDGERQQRYAQRRADHAGEPVADWSTMMSPSPPPPAIAAIVAVAIT